MPYSDNLYSMVDDDSDIEPIGEPSNQHGLGVISQHSPLDTYDATDAHAGHDTVDSGEGVDVEDPQLLSPTDGYFGTATDIPSEPRVPTSSNVPYVPNVLVEDPSLQRNSAEGKAQEAEQERLRNGQGFSNSDDGYTAAYPSHTTAASRNGSTSAYVPSPTQQSIGSVSQSVAATYYSPSSSTHIPSAATPTSYTTYGTRNTAYHAEHLPFLPREAPPAYTPSPTTPSHSRNYSTFSQSTGTVNDMGRPEETQGLLPRQPESMRDPDPDGLDKPQTGWRGRMRSIGRYRNWGIPRTVLVALLLVLTAVGFRTILATDQTGHTNPSAPPTDRPHTQPQPKDPAMSYPEIDDGFNWGAASTCMDSRIARPIQTFDLSFGGDKPLTLVERTTDDDGRRGWSEVHVQGVVIFRRAGSGTPNSAVTVEIVANDDGLPVDTLWDAEGQTLKIIVPHRFDWSQSNVRPCVNVKATVWVPEDGKLDILKVDARHLDIKLLDNLSLSISQQTKLVSTVGTIIAASTGTDARDDKIIDLGTPDSFHFHSRIIEVKTTSAPIKGSWPLYDYLGLQSTSGNIKVCIEPKDANPDTSAPAILYITSTSGDVKFREPIHAAEHAFNVAQALSEPEKHQAELKAETLLPPRDYRLDVHTTSGDIIGAAAFSSSAGFKSTSGTISLDLLPVLDSSLVEDGSRDVALQTTTTSGSTGITVLDPLWINSDSPSIYVALKTADSKDPMLRCLYSSHSATSANIRLRYPASWEGDIALSSLSGGVKAGGDGVRLIKAGSGWPGLNKSLLARKGEEGFGGKVLGKSTSGDIDVWVGDKSN